MPKASYTSLLGDLTINNNAALADVNGFANLTTVDGIMDIEGNDLLPDINGFPSLTSAGGISIKDNAALLSLNGFPNLTSLIGTEAEDVVGDLTINNNAALADVNGFANLTTVDGIMGIEGNDLLPDINGFPSLASAGGISIKNNATLVSINGFQNLTSLIGTEEEDVVGDLTINNNAALADVNGFANLTTVDGILGVEGNDLLPDINGFPSLASACGISIKNNAALVSINGFQNLTSLIGTDAENVEGDLTINNNVALADVNGFPNLTSVAGIMGIEGNDFLPNVDGFQSLTSAGGLRIIENASLLNLDGLQNLTSLIGTDEENNVVGDLTLTDNISLSQCCGLYPVLNDGGVAGTVAIANNLSGCNSESQIINSGPCIVCQAPDPLTFCVRPSQCQAGPPMLIDWAEVQGAVSYMFHGVCLNGGCTFIRNVTTSEFTTNINAPNNFPVLIELTSVCPDGSTASTGFFNYIITTQNCDNCPVASASPASSDELKAINLSSLLPIADDWRLYPNPTTGNLYIATSYPGKYKLEVLDIYGRIVQRDRLIGQLSRLDMSALDTGIYLLRIHNSDVQKIIRFSKL